MAGIEGKYLRKSQKEPFCTSQNVNSDLNCTKDPDAVEVKIVPEKSRDEQHSSTGDTAVEKNEER